MKINYAVSISFVALTGLMAFGETALLRAGESAQPYKIINSAQVPGIGGVDYVFADSDSRRVYVPRGEQVLVFDLDSLRSVGAIPNARARGVAVDPKSHHGFCQQ